MTYDAAASPNDSPSRERHPLQHFIAIDESEQSARALRDAGALRRETRDVHVTWFHVLKPMPRELLEHGGSEDPVEDSRRVTEFQQDQENWVRAESTVE